MKYLFVLVILTAALVTSSTSQQCSSTSGTNVGVTSDADFWKGIDGAQFITELTDDETYNQFTQENKPKTFVMYYTTWCGYSKKARKGFAGAAKKLNAKVAFGAVDCDKVPNACQNSDHPISGYPSFFLFKNGAWNDEYQRQTTTQAFVTYLNQK